MKNMPHMILRSTLLMSFLLILACLALTRGAPVASADPSYPAPVESDDNKPIVDSQPVTSACKLDNRYPQTILQWCDLITYHAEEHDLPPNLVAALIWLESGGNPDAYSRSGAVGLMQIMPRDGLAASFMCVNGPCFASRPTIAELQDPEFNIAYGTRLLAGLFARYQDIREALKRYGPMDAGYTYADKVLGIYERYHGE